LKQIERYSTDTELILQYGLAFCGKKAAIEFKQTRNSFAAKLKNQGKKLLFHRIN